MHSFPSLARVNFDGGVHLTQQGHELLDPKRSRMNACKCPAGALELRQLFKHEWMPERNAETDRSLILSFMHERKIARRKPACRAEVMLLTKAECMHSGMNEGMLARRPGRAPCRPPHLPPPAFGRHCPGPWQILAIRVSSPTAVVHAGRGRVGCAAQQACMFARTLVCTGLACFLDTCQHARMHAYIHSCMNAWRMAGVSFRSRLHWLIGDQHSGAAGC